MKLSKIIQEFRDERSMELYGKPECQLQIAERQRLNQYVRDYENPTWKNVEIDGKETGYLISNVGVVQSIKQGKIKYLSPTYNADGYTGVKLYLDGIKKSISTHRLVAQAFIPNPENKPEVNHKNGVKDFNWVGNLEWVTGKENVRHAFDTKLNRGRLGPENGMCICTNEQIHEICKLLQEGKQPKEISSILGIRKNIIDSIKGYRTWVHISKDYDFSKVKRWARPNTKLRSDIRGLFKSGVFNYSEILNKLNLEDTPKNRLYLSKIKHEFKVSSEGSSTTIPRGSKG